MRFYRAQLVSSPCWVEHRQWAQALIAKIPSLLEDEAFEDFDLSIPRRPPSPDLNVAYRILGLKRQRGGFEHGDARASKDVVPEAVVELGAAL